MERNQLTRVRPVEKKKTSFTKGLKIIYFNNHRLPQSKAFRAVDRFWEFWLILPNFLEFIEDFLGKHTFETLEDFLDLSPLIFHEYHPLKYL